MSPPSDIPTRAPHHPRPRDGLRLLPVAALFLSVLVFAVAEMAQRLLPFYTQGLVLSLLPLSLTART